MIVETVVGFLLLYIVVTEYFNRIERKKLLEMVMAKSLPEFKQLEKEEKPKPKQLPPDLMPIDSVTPDQFEMAIKKELGREPIIEKLKSKLAKHGR